MVFVLASCSNVSESYAKKVNEAADKGEHFTYAEVLEDLGDEAIDLLGNKYANIIIAVKGCKTVEELKAKFEEAEGDVEGIIITIAADKATKAEYRVIEEDDLK
jgi:hypothetical protein